FEQTIVSIWKRLLNIDRVGIEANFFEIGGDSLLAMRVISSARRELNAELGIKDLFTHPTASKLAAHLRSISNGSILPPIQKANPRPKSIPLSFSQESLWFIDQLEGSVQYHLPIVLKIQGQLDLEAMEYALKYIVNRHEIFRTVIHEKDGLKEQLVMDADSWQLSVVEGQKYQQDAEIMQNIEQFVQEPFDLSNDFMMRARLIRLGNQDHVLVLVMHHIAFDGWSYSVLIKELEALYKAYPENLNSALVSLPFQHGEYALWQRKLIRGKFIEEKTSYWKNKLAGAVTLQLPTDHAKLSSSSTSTKGAVSQFRIDSILSGKIRAIAKQEGATLFMTLLAAFKVLLYRYSSQEDICVGTVMAGRQQTETEDLIGYFINTLPLRSQLDGKASFTDLLEQIKNTTLDAYANQEVPFERIVAAVAVERVENQNPLFQVMFLLQNVPEVPQLNLNGASVSKMEVPQKTSKFDLTFSLTETAEGLMGTVEYRTDLYQEQTIEKMMGHYQQLLHSITGNPEASIGKLKMLTSEEKHQLLISNNNNAFNYPTGKTIIDLFEEQVLKNPHGKALVFEGQQLSYQELDHKSNQLAHFLRSKGVKEESLVLVCIGRSLEMVVGMMGILKAGAAYVPIDPHYPLERIRYIQEDTGAQLVLSSKESKTKLQHLAGLDIIELDRKLAILEGQSTSKVKTLLSPDHLAYVLYTSGSTGTPKGVMIEHRNTFYFVCWCKQEFGSSHFELVYASTSICFDLSVFELFFPLSIGKSIRLIESGLQISKYLSHDTFVLINTVPSVVQNLLEEKADLSRVSIINMAGEPISPKILKELDPEKIEVRNLYGPTEDTTYSTVYKLDKKKRLLIGKPISNTSIYILNPENELNPEGVPGEICIGGAGVARGYLNHEELTTERFIRNPFHNGHTKIYKTGDLGRWKAGGFIEYLGRKDEQVKIHGYRIELGEIESVLHQFEGVKQAAVVVKQDLEGDKYLVGYIVPNGKYELAAIIDFLKEKLPHFMIPSSWEKLDGLPLNPNGKIDRKALSDSVGSAHSGKEFVAPSTKLERELARIWEKILNLERVGIHDNFFEIGGHSLLAYRIISAVREQIKIELGIRELFSNPTIAELSGKIKKKAIELQSKENGEKERNSLIPIKSTGNKAPLYIVHGEDLDVLSLFTIAKNMDPEQPVFGFQAKGLNGKKISLTGVEIIASHYIDEILRKNPDGPYILAGYSLGGTIAYEMAKQLKSSGKEVKDLIMFDTYAYQSDHRDGWLVKLVNQLKHGIGKRWFDILLLINHPQVLKRIKTESYNRKIAKIKNLIKPKKEAQKANITINNEALQKEARKNYVFSSYDGRIQLLRAKIPSYYVPDSRYYGWKSYVNQVNVWEVDGEHTTLFNTPNDVSFAKTLQKILDID
ncbi:MAG: amino acid adenylation domain-containing protein, partial [Anditalea sp.]